MENISYYRNIFSISVVEFMDKERNDNQMIKYSIKLIEKNDNDDKLYKELTPIVHHNWNSNLVALYLSFFFEKGNALFVYLNPEKDDSVEDISGISMLYKKSTSKLILILILL